jgi:superfamily I DNA/RNA helicase
MLAAISRAKDEVVDPKRYAELAEAMIHRASTAEDLEAAERALEVARVYAVYQDLKRKAECIDFGDLVSLPVRLLEDTDTIRSTLQGRYDHVLVDEYQDVNRGSVRLLAALSRGGNNLWAVGDAKQSIYRFRGASSFNMARFGKDDFPGGVRGRLKRNYRSVEGIVSAFSTFAGRMRAGGEGSGLEADREQGAKPELRTVDRADEQTAALAGAIEEMRRQGYAYRDQAVLCTGNEKLSMLGQDLERLGVPVLFLGSLFERPEIKELLSLLSILADGRAMGLARIACLPEFSMPVADVATVLDHLRTDESEAGDWLSDLDALTGLSGEGQAALGEVARVLHGFDRSASPWSVLAIALLDRTRIAARIASSGEILDRTRGIAIWQFMNFLRTQPSGEGLPISRLLDRVRRLVRLGDDRDLRQLPAAAQAIDAVRLMTIHGAKGLEFPIVHVPGLNSDTLPRTPSAPPCPAPDGMVEGGEGTALEIYRAGQAEEQECLFYVALSRARDRLLLYAPTQKANGQRRALSPFLDALGSFLERRTITPARNIPPPPVAGDVELHVEGGLRFSASQIALYETCPRRFFYTHVLQVGGRRTTTAFMQMHEAVRSVVQRLIGDCEEIDGSELDRRVDASLRTHGLGENGYLAEYKTLALSMVGYLLSIRKGHRPESPVSLELAFGEERIVFRPDDVLLGPDGGLTLRRVKTGHLRSAESKDVGAAALVLAVKEKHPDATVELVHLSDQAARPIVLSDRELQHRRNKLAGFLAEIRQGRFPAAPSGRTCPGCPAFFICGPVPSGILRRKF